MLSTLEERCDFVHQRMLTLLRLTDDPRYSMIVFLFLQCQAGADATRCRAAICGLVPEMTQEQVSNLIFAIDAAHFVAWRSLIDFYIDAADFEQVLGSTTGPDRGVAAADACL